MTMTLKKAGKAKEIAKAALDQFTQAGFHATSLEKIAAVAGIGKSTVYEYYKNKEELYIAAVQEAVDQWFEEMNEIAARTQEPLERFERIAMSAIGCGGQKEKGEQRFFFEILMQTVMEGGVFFERRHLIRDIHQHIIRTLANFLLDGVSTGRLKPEIARDAEKIAITFLGFLDGIKLFALAASDYIDIPEQIRFFMQHLKPTLQLTQPASSDTSQPPCTNKQDGHS